MAGQCDPASLFNLATLHLHVPPAPPSSQQAPPSTSLTPSHELPTAQLALQQQATDDWVTAIAGAEEREQAYYDETLPFYLLIRLPSSPSHPLNRSQATSFLLPSLTGDAPHLSLNADVSYIEGAPPGPSHGSQGPPYTNPGAPTTPGGIGRGAPPPRRDSVPSSAAALGGSSVGSGSGLGSGYGQTGGGGTRRGSLPPMEHVATGPGGAGPRIPLTPSPLPSTRARDGQYASSEAGVLLWSHTFEAGSRKPVSGGGSPLLTGMGMGKGRVGKMGRVWVGREGGEKSGGDWIGVWEFGGDVAFLRTPLISPRLCLTLTATFRDDPRLADLLERAATVAEGHASNSSGAKGAGKTFEEILKEEEEYLVESFDDVNLLSGLSSFISSHPLHLPASRLPLPFSAPHQAARRSSRPSLSLAPGSTLPALPADAPLHPSIRRAVRRVLDVKSALNVRMRTVSCPVAGLGEGEGEEGMRGLGLGMEGRGEMEGLVMCVEVEGGSGGSEEGEEEGFQVESVEVEMTCSSATSSVGGGGDVEIRPVAGERTDKTFPLLLSSKEQHNFLYAVTFSSEAAQLASAAMQQGFDPHRHQMNGRPSFEPVPIAVMTSPSQRFAARFGDPPVEDPSADQRRAQEERERVSKVEASPWLRSVAIVVRGRPVKLAGGRRGVSAPGRSLTMGYSVEDAASGQVEDDDAGAILSPTSVFSSRWNCTLDISPFARRTPPKLASFNPPPQPNIGSTLSSAALARLSTSSAPFPSSPASKRSSRTDMPQVEAVAGSKRHTMASLASLASKSPVLQQRAFRRSADGASLGGGERPHLTLGALPPRVAADSRALPPTPFDVQTPGATGPQRRFFSLPPGGGGAPGEQQHYATTPGQHPSFGAFAQPAPLAQPPPTTPAYPPHLSARAAVPHADPLARPLDRAATSEVQREGWRTANLAPGFERPPSGGGWSGVSPHGQSVGLGFDGGMGLPSDVEMRGYDGDRGGGRGRSGSIIVSVSLIPLRAVKSQRPTLASRGAGDEHVSSPYPEVDVHAGRLSPHTTFQFPSPSSSPDPSSTSQTPPPFLIEQQRRSSSSLYPPPAAAPTVKQPRPRAPRIGLLDVFLVEVFIVNRGDEVKRFTVGVPVRRAGEVKGGEAGKGEERVARIVALENDVRIGPLAPNTCASVGLRFLAIRPGAHTLEELRLVDLSTGLETRLRNPLSVVVEG